MLRYLRITVTVGSLLAFVLLHALWGRSFSARDRLDVWLPTPGYLQIISESGVVTLIATTEHRQPTWRLKSWPALPPFRHWYFALRNTGRSGLLQIMVPYWLLVLSAAASTAAPFVPWSRRFSLRTLLIATTLLAVLLGVLAASR